MFCAVSNGQVYKALLAGVFVSLVTVSSLCATEEYAEQAGVECSVCHLDPSGGGELTAEGRGYALSLGLPEATVDGETGKAGSTNILIFLLSGLT